MRQMFGPLRTVCAVGPAIRNDIFRAAALTVAAAIRSFCAVNENLEMIELFARGAAAGVNFLLAGLFLASKAPVMRRVAGALFAFGTCIYILVSGGYTDAFLGVFAFVLMPIAIFNGVFFWWFALSLFDDAFVMTWRKMIPLIVIGVLHYGERMVVGQPVSAVSIVHNLIIIGLAGHAVWIALHDRAEDLVAPRRHFRLVFAYAVGGIVVFTAAAETYFAFHPVPAVALQVQAASVLGLSYVFAFWLLSANQALFAREKPGQGTAPLGLETATAAPSANPAFASLMVLMDDGVYREEGLSVANLAEKVGIPEHQLRRLINTELGYRNFSAFLNSRRIEDAKSMLSDPKNAQKQVLQIALNLGYGSIAPFNRAFKAATGVTPTAYRKQAFGGG